MQTVLVISALGPDRVGIVDALTRQILDSGCHVGESRMAVLGSEFAAIMLVRGNWNEVVKLENVLPRLEASLGLTIQAKRTQTREETEQAVPYGVEVVSIDRPGIVSDVANFFSSRGINLEDVYTSTYPAPHTSAAMFSLHLTIGIPTDMSIATVRGEFMDFCDDRNLDAVLAPVK